MSMRRLIEGLEEARNAPSWADAAKFDGDFGVGDFKSSRQRYRYLNGDNIDALATDTARYLLSRLSNRHYAIADKQKFMTEFIYGVTVMLEQNLDDIVEKSLKASNAGK